VNTIDRARPQKLYCQIIEILQRHIERGEWKVGSRIPTEEELCSRYNVSRGTVRLAIEELVSSGYLKRFQGKGTFVRRRNPDNRIAMLTHLGGNEVCHYASCLTRDVGTTVLQPPGHIRDHLSLADDEPCFYAMRLTIADCTPVVLQKLYVARSRMSGVPDPAALTDSSPHACIERLCGARIQSIREMSDVSTMDERERALLELGPFASALRTRQTYYGQGDTPLGFSESLYRTDTYPRMVAFERLRI
jgi:GntR family transcriptional regulator